MQIKGYQHKYLDSQRANEQLTSSVEEKNKGDLPTRGAAME